MGDSVGHTDDAREGMGWELLRHLNRAAGVGNLLFPTNGQLTCTGPAPASTGLHQVAQDEAVPLHPAPCVLIPPALAVTLETSSRSNSFGTAGPPHISTHRARLVCPAAPHTTAGGGHGVANPITLPLEEAAGRSLRGRALPRAAPQPPPRPRGTASSPRVQGRHQPAAVAMTSQRAVKEMINAGR